MPSSLSFMILLSAVSLYLVAAQPNEARSNRKGSKGPPFKKFKDIFIDGNDTSIGLCDSNETLDADFNECLDLSLSPYLKEKEGELGKAKVDQIKARFAWIASSQVCWKSFAHREKPIVRDEDKKDLIETIYEDFMEIGEKTRACVRMRKKADYQLASQSTSQSNSLVINQLMIFALFIPILWQLSI